MPVEVTSIEISFQGWAIWNIGMERLRIEWKNDIPENRLATVYYAMHTFLFK